MQKVELEKIELEKLCTEIKELLRYIELHKISDAVAVEVFKTIGILVKNITDLETVLALGSDLNE